MIKERKDNDFLIQKLKNIKVENGNTKNEVMIAKQKIKDLQKKEKNIKIEDYSQNNLRNIIKQDMSVDYRFYENINSNDLEFVLVSNHSNTIKRSRT